VDCWKKTTCPLLPPSPSTPLEVLLEVLEDLPPQVLEGQVADQQLGRILVAAAHQGLICKELQLDCNIIGRGRAIISKRCLIFCAFLGEAAKVIGETSGRSNWQPMKRTFAEKVGNPFSA